MKYFVTKKFLNWIVGWSYVLDGMVIVLSFGLLNSDFCLYTQTWYLDYCFYGYLGNKTNE